MNYLFAIKTAILLFPIIALLITIPFILLEYHKYGSIHKWKTVIIYSFVLYMLTLYFLVILPLPSFEEVAKLNTPKMNLIPFSFIQDILKESSFIITNPKTYLKALTEPCIYTVLFNIIMTIPYGMYLRYYFKCSKKKTIILSFALSLFFEITQLTGLYFIYKRPYRLFDVDDLIMNTLGGLLGYYIVGCINKFLPSREEIDKKAREEGKVVSGLRRITLFFLDAFIYGSLTLILYLLIKIPYLKYATFLIYYILIPYLGEGKTLASKFLNVRISFPNKKIIRLLTRSIFLYIYYFYLPYFSIFIVIKIVPELKLSIGEEVWTLLLYSITLISFYLINSITLLKKRTIYYDTIFKTEYISTIE